MPSEWNMFVKKVYEEEHAKNPAFQFKDALKEASERKKRGEMSGNMAMGVKSHKASKRAKKSSRRGARSRKMNASESLSLAGGKRRRKSRSHRRR